MKPYAKYVFKHDTENKSRYIETEHRGGNAPNFPMVTTRKRGNKPAGTRQIGYRKNDQPPKDGHRYYEYVIETAKGHSYTGVNFTKEYPTKGYGDNGNDGGSDAILIDFSDNHENLTLLFFKDGIDTAITLFHEWVNGELAETVDTDMLPVAGGEKKPGGD